MVIAVVAAVAKRVHQLGGGVQDMLRRHQRAGVARRAGGRLMRPIGGVRLGRGGQIDDQLGDRQIPFRRAQALIGLPTGDRLANRLRIGKANILNRETGQAAQDIARVLAARQHAVEPIEPRVGVRAAQGFVQGTDQVVMLFLVLIVNRRALLQRPGDPGGVKRRVKGGAQHAFNEI